MFLLFRQVASFHTTRAGFGSIFPGCQLTIKLYCNVSSLSNINHLPPGELTRT